MLGYYYKFFLGLLALLMLAIPVGADSPKKVGDKHSIEMAVLVDLTRSFGPYFETTRRQLQSWAAALREGDSVVLAVFSNESCNVLWKGSIQSDADRQALSSIIGGFQLSPSDGSEPIQALNRTLEELTRVQSEQAGRRLFLFFHDGYADTADGGRQSLKELDWQKVPRGIELMLLSYVNQRDSDLVQQLARHSLQSSVLSPQGTEVFMESLVAEMKSRSESSSAPIPITEPELASPLLVSGGAILVVSLVALLAGLWWVAGRRSRVPAGVLSLVGARAGGRGAREQLQLFQEDGTGGRRRIAGPFEMVKGLRVRVATEGGHVNLPGDDLIRAELKVTRKGLVLRPGLGTTHPVRVNGKRVQGEIAVQGGQLIEFTPNWTLRLEIGRPALDEVAN